MCDNKIIYIDNELHKKSYEDGKDNEDNIYENKVIIHKFYKNLVSDEITNEVNLRNIDNYKKALNSVNNHEYIKNINELKKYNIIKVLSARNLCNICFKQKYIYYNTRKKGDKIYLTVSGIYSRNICNLIYDDKIIIFKEKV